MKGYCEKGYLKVIINLLRIEKKNGIYRSFFIAYLF